MPEPDGIIQFAHFTDDAIQIAVQGVVDYYEERPAADGLPPELVLKFGDGCSYRIIRLPNANQVSCESCGKQWILSPDDDLYTSNRSGKKLCLTCLMAEGGIAGARVVELNEKGAEIEGPDIPQN